MDKGLNDLAKALQGATVAEPRSTKTMPVGGTVEQEFHAILAADFLALELPPREMLLAPILPEKSISMLFGPRGLGKTFMGLGIAIAVASGAAFLRWTAPRPAKVLYVDGEMPAKSLQARISELLKHADNPEPARENLSILSADLVGRSLPDLGAEEGRKALAPLVELAELIIIDNLSTLCRTGKENEAEGWAEIQAWALDQRRAGRSVLFIHHAGKTGEQRGTSKREDVMDTVIRLSRPDDYQQRQGARFRVEFTKARGIMGDDAEPFEAALQDGNWTLSEAVNVREAQIGELLAQGLSVRKIAKQIGIPPTTVHRFVQRLNSTNAKNGAEANDTLL